MAKIYMCEQGTLEWRKLRAGIPTASSADRIITPTGKLAKNDTSRAYASELVAERLINEIGAEIDGIPYMERGHEMEPVAVEQYEFANGVRTMRVGLITTDDGRWGASPDRLIVPPDDNPTLRAGLEIKAPKAATHIRYLTQGEAPEYRAQVAMQMLVAELEWVDFYSFHPRCPPFQTRIYRDEQYLATLRHALEVFCEQVDEMEAEARSKGTFLPFADAAIPTRGNPQAPIEGEMARDILSGRASSQQKESA